MSRRYAEPVLVWCRSGTPVRFRRRHRTYRVVEVLGWWLEAVPWWRGEPAGQREVWRVETCPDGVFELSRHGADWVLRGIAD